nr:integrase, catalytic region, zinc finger, CCHC-type, peptidase aspartic, catalytic [Tanacetum cinerariifolium]
MQTQTSNTLHNAIMEAGSNDRPPMLAPGNYVQWKSRIKRYIDTKPNHELINYCLENPLYKLDWQDIQVLVSEGSPITTTERIRKTYKNVSQDIRDQLNAEAEAVQIILTGIDNDIYSIVDACPNACEINQCKVNNHQVNIQFLLQLQPEWQRFMTLVKQSQELQTVSYHKLYDILKQHHHEVNEIRAERIARVANLHALVAHQQPVYHPQTHPTHYSQNSSTRSQQAATRNRGKSTVNTPQPIYDQEPSMVDEDDKMSKDKEIDKLMALISLSFKKIYKPTNNNLRTSSNTRVNQDNSLRINKNVGYENQRIGNVAGAKETVGSTVVQKSGIQCYNCKEFRHVARKCQKPKRAKDAAYHREKMLLYQELEAHYMYMAQLQQVSPDAADSGPIFDDEPLQKVSIDDHYNVFAMESTHHEQSKSIHDIYPIEQDAQNLLASLIEKLKCEIDESKNRNKFLETSNEALIEKLKGEIEDFKNKNKSLESSNNFFKEAKNRLSETNNLLYDDYKKSEAELARRNSKEYASQMELECAKLRGDFLSYKMDYQKSCNKYTEMINDLNQTISKLKDKLSAHQETISILSKQKETQIKLYKTREDKELEKIIELENKVKVLDNIVYKTGQSVQTTNMLNSKCRTSFVKPEFLKKAQRANPHLRSLKSNPQGDRVMHNNSRGKKQEVEDHRRSVKLSKNKTSVTACNDSLNAKTLNVKYVSTMCDKCVLHDQHDMCVLKSIAKPLKETVASESNKEPKKCTRKLYERVSKTCSWWYPKFTPSGYIWKHKFEKENVNLNLVEIVLFIIDSRCSKYMTENLKLLINFVVKFLGTVKFGNDQIAPILRYGDLVQGAVTIKRVYYVEGLNHNLFSVGQFCDVDLEVAFRKSTCFIRDLKGNDLLTDEVTNLQCDYLELLEKCEGLETEISKSKMMSNSFESVQKHAINLEVELQQCKEKNKNDMLFKVNKSKYFCKEREQYFEMQDLKAQLQEKGIVISELKKLIEKIKGKSVDTKFEKSSVIRQPNAFKSQRPSVL